jgi:hypothetical protein
LAVSALLRASAIAGHVASLALASLPVGRVRLAPAAVLAQLNPLGVVALALVRLVIPSLAVLARERDCDPNVSAGHWRSKVDVGNCQRPTAARLPATSRREPRSVAWNGGSAGRSCLHAGRHGALAGDNVSQQYFLLT